MEKTPCHNKIRQQNNKDEKWQKQLQTICQSLKNLKTIEERNNYIKEVVRQREVDKLIQEKQTIQQKAYLLDRSKKKFLSLIRSKDPETFFLKFKPIQKPLNMLRMVCELNLKNKTNDKIENNEPVKENRITRISAESRNRKSSLPNIQQSSKTLEHLVFEQQRNYIVNANFRQKKFVKQQNLSNSQIVQKSDAKTIESQISQFNDEVQNVKINTTNQMSKIPSQILARNGIYMQLKVDPHPIKVNQQYDLCLEDDSSSLASHTELQLDNIYDCTQQLNRGNKYSESKSKEYQEESLKLFYKKIYFKQ